MNRTLVRTLAASALFGFASTAYPIAITTTTDADVLAAAVSAGGGLTILSAALSAHTNPAGAASSGTYTNAAGTYNNVGPGIVISSGNVADYNTGPSTSPGKTTNFGVLATAGQEALLDPITGGSFTHLDVTQLDLTFTSDTGEVFFSVVWGSEEFPVFVGSSFIDAFGLYLNGTNIAFLAGAPINVNHPSMQALAGTELNGILTPPPGPGGNPIVTFSAATISGVNTLTFIVADSGDGNLDTTVFISSLAGVAQEPTPGLPEPGTLLLMAAALVGFAGWRRRGR